MIFIVIVLREVLKVNLELIITQWWRYEVVLQKIKVVKMGRKLFAWLFYVNLQSFKSLYKSCSAVIAVLLGILKKWKSVITAWKSPWERPKINLKWLIMFQKGSFTYYVITKGGFGMITLKCNFLLYPMPNLIAEGGGGSRNRQKVIT